MPLDPSLFLHATFFLYGVALISGILIYGKYTQPALGKLGTPRELRNEGNVTPQGINNLDLLGIGLLIALFAALYLQQQVPVDDTKKTTLTPIVLVVGMIAQAVPALIVIAILMGRGTHLSTFFGLKWSNARYLIVIAPLGVIATYIFVIGLNLIGFPEWLVHAFGKEIEVQPAVRLYQEADAVIVRVFLAISAVIVAPIVEEVVFRGYIYTVTKRYTARIFSTLVSAIFFAVVHNFIPGLLPLAFLAIILTISYEVTGSLWAPISIHALFNSCTLLMQEYQFHNS